MQPVFNRRRGGDSGLAVFLRRGGDDRFLRREIMRKFFVILLSFALAVAMAGAGMAAPAKILVYARGADCRGLDPAYVDDGESAKVIVNIYDNLVKYKTGSTEIEPALATSWTVSRDSKVWTFKLRKGVKFHDGTPFNAAAVKFSVERQLPPLATDDMPYASFTFEPIKKVEVVDNYTVKFTLSRPYAPFLANMAMCLAAPIVSPAAVKKYGKDFIQHPVGTGAFKFEKWDRDQQIVLVKNPNYWGKKAFVDKVVYKVTKENAVRASELITGAIDIMDGVDPNDVKKLESSKMKVIKNPGMNINYMGFLCHRKPFSDVRLRQAISMAINRETLVKYLYQGYSKVANGPLPGFIPGYDPKLSPLGYDPEKAKKLLAEAGYKDLSFNFITYSNPRPYNSVNGVKLAEAVQAELLKIGVKTTIKAYPWKEYKDVLMKGAAGDAFFYGWTGDNGDADNFLSLLDSRQIESTLNSAKYANPEVDELLDKAASTMNPQERVKLYHQLQKILVNDAPWVFISHAVDMAAVRPNVKGFSPHPTGVSWLNTVRK
jgi:peptide/nickel transport system substrate-binding protein